MKVNLSNAVAEYELFEYFQLRHLRIRELRYMLLNQFNYLRSIEKRLTCDVYVLIKKIYKIFCITFLLFALIRFILITLIK